MDFKVRGNETFSGSSPPPPPPPPPRHYLPVLPCLPTAVKDSSVKAARSHRPAFPLRLPLSLRYPPERRRPGGSAPLAGPVNLLHSIPSHLDPTTIGFPASMKPRLFRCFAGHGTARVTRGRPATNCSMLSRFVTPDLSGDGNRNLTRRFSLLTGRPPPSHPPPTPTTISTSVRSPPPPSPRGTWRCTTERTTVHAVRHYTGAVRLGLRYRFRGALSPWLVPPRPFLRACLACLACLESWLSSTAPVSTPRGRKLCPG